MASALLQVALRKAYRLNLSVLYHLALAIARQQRKYVTAEAEAMTGRRRWGGMKMCLGGEHPSTLTSMSKSALVQDWQGKYEEVEEMGGSSLLMGVKIMHHVFLPVMK